MNAKGVFSTGISGMGPALSDAGELIVNAKIEARNRLLDDLEKRGLDADALTHRHHHDRECAQDRTASSESDKADAAMEEVIDEETVVAFVRSRQKVLEEALHRIRLQEGEIEHLKHQRAVQENKILLLRDALEASRNKELKAQ